jgi:hypothetical protein
VHKKKKFQKTKPRASRVLSADEKALLDALLGETAEKIEPTRLQELIPAPRLALAIIENLSIASARTPELLRAFSKAFPEKEVQKAVRKILFKLKQKGISVPESGTESETGFILGRPEKEEPKAYVGPVDGAGSRAVLIAIPQIPQGHDLGLGVINDEDGILEFSFGRYSRKNAKEVQKIFFEKVPSMVETDLPHAAALLERGYSLRAGKGESSGDYLRLRPWLLDHARPIEKPKVYEVLSSEAVSRNALTESQIQKLLNHEYMATWIVDPEKLKPVIEEINNAEQSRILVSEIQKIERINQIKQASIGKLYPDTERAMLKQRLEEMAYVFFKSEEEPYARLALACAKSLEDKDSFLKVNSFLSALLEKSLDLYFRGRRIQDTKGSPDQSPSRIVLR